MSPRVVLAVAGLLALALPAPGPNVPGVVLTVTGLVALATAVLHPGSTAPAVLIAAAALSWLAGDDGAAASVRLPVLALALAVVHSAAALAAVVPAGSRVPRALLLRWAGWTAAAAVVGVGAVSATALLPGSAPAVPVTVAALAAVVVAVVVAGVVLVRSGGRD